MLGCKPSKNPMDAASNLQHEGFIPLPQAKVYRRLIGRLQYLCYTRPDITFAVNKLSQFLAAPNHHHLVAAHKVLRYLKGSIGLGLFLHLILLWIPVFFLMQIMAIALILGAQFQAFAFFLALPLSYGVLRNSRWFLDLQPKLSIVQWHKLPVRCLG